VIGDIQILNQVKRSYQTAADLELAGPFLHRLMHTIFFTNKRVVQETAFRDGAASLSYATIELIESLTQNIFQPRILLIGVGEIGEDVNEIETKESMGAGGSGSFEGPVFSDVVLKKDIHKFHNSNLKEQQEEVGEATDASSSGGYDVPLFGKTPKGRRNPLKIDGPDSIYKGRAVTDKKFPKWGGPGGVFVKIKEKCKKFPYCNQGDTGALEFIKEDKEIVQAITETSKKYGIPYKEMEKIVLNEINKIFI
jgi:hypothetical protein